MAEGNTQVMAFYITEALEVHRLCSEVGVPAEAEGERLSMSQRVALLVREVKAARVAAPLLQRAKGAVL